MKLKPEGQSGTWKNVPTNCDLCGKPVKGRSSNPRVLILVEVHQTASTGRTVLVGVYT